MGREETECRPILGNTVIQAQPEGEKSMTVIRMKCPHCGKKTRTLTLKKCKHCNWPMDPKDPIYSQPKNKTIVEKIKKFRKRLFEMKKIVVFAALIAVAVIFFAVFNSGIAGLNNPWGILSVIAFLVILVGLFWGLIRSFLDRKSENQKPPKPAIIISGVGLAALIIFICIGVATSSPQNSLNQILSSGEPNSTAAASAEVVIPEASVNPAATATPVATVKPASSTDDIGYIKYSVDNGENWQKANELTGDYGHRIAFTCAQALFPNAAWDYKFSGEDWKKIEETWIDVQVSVPEGVVSRIWCFSWKQGKDTHDGGYLMELGQGYYEFSIKNGEAQNWSPNDSFCSIDLNRIFSQKRDGNVNVEHELAFTGITENLKERIPDDLKYNEVTTGPTATTDK